VSPSIGVYLEKGKGGAWGKKVFAGALEFPGWCRSGPDERAALQALVEYGPRYAAVIDKVPGKFKPPSDISAFDVVEVLKGSSSTDFGTPGAVPSRDAEELGARDMKKLIAIHEACWDAFDAAARKAAGKTLSLGPRGGGRSLEKMTRHVREGVASYLSGLGGKVPRSEEELRAAFIETVEARARGQLPDKGPRGGARLTARYAIRASAWHLLDHAWEIEERVIV
jgi:hypothetical protein